MPKFWNVMGSDPMISFFFLGTIKQTIGCRKNVQLSFLNLSLNHYSSRIVHMSVDYGMGLCVFWHELCATGFCQVEVEFEDGSSFHLPAEFLRVYSPAADSKIRSVAGEKVMHHALSVLSGTHGLLSLLDGQCGAFLLIHLLYQISPFTRYIHSQWSCRAFYSF